MRDERGLLDRIVLRYPSRALRIMFMASKSCSVRHTVPCEPDPFASQDTLPRHRIARGIQRLAEKAFGRAASRLAASRKSIIWPSSLRRGTDTCLCPSPYISRIGAVTPGGCLQSRRKQQRTQSIGGSVYTQAVFWCTGFSRELRLAAGSVRRTYVVGAPVLQAQAG
jgi:hypothetical protein